MIIVSSAGLRVSSSDAEDLRSTGRYIILYNPVGPGKYYFTDTSFSVSGRSVWYIIYI